MIQITQKLGLCLLIGSLTFFGSCQDDDVEATDFGIFSAQMTTAIMNGEIDSNTPQYWDNFIAASPDITTLIMKNSSGSSGDEANLVAARKIKTKNLTIHLPADAEIASGAVDFYLAGAVRAREQGNKIGVHSWSDGTNSLIIK